MGQKENLASWMGYLAIFAATIAVLNIIEAVAGTKFASGFALGLLAGVLIAPWRAA